MKRKKTTPFYPQLEPDSRWGRLLTDHLGVDLDQVVTVTANHIQGEDKVHIRWESSVHMDAEEFFDHLFAR